MSYLNYRSKNYPAYSSKEELQNKLDIARKDSDFNALYQIQFFDWTRDLTESLCEVELFSKGYYLKYGFTLYYHLQEKYTRLYCYGEPEDFLEDILKQKDSSEILFYLDLIKKYYVRC